MFGKHPKLCHHPIFLANCFTSFYGSFLEVKGGEEEVDMNMFAYQYFVSIPAKCENV